MTSPVTLPPGTKRPRGVRVLVASTGELLVIPKTPPPRDPYGNPDANRNKASQTGSAGSAAKPQWGVVAWNYLEGMPEIATRRVTFDWDEDQHPRDAKGRFGDKADDNAGTWTRLSGRLLEAHMVNQLTAAGVKAHVAERAVKGEPLEGEMWALRHETEHSVSTSITVTFPANPPISDADKQAVTDQLRALDAKYPIGRSLSVSVNPDAPSWEFGRSFAGGRIELNPIIFDEDGQRRIRDAGIEGKFVQPAVEDPVRYIVTHEYGHQQEWTAAQHDGKETEINSTLRGLIDQGPSEYSHTNGNEAYAESFAEHVLGSDDNPLVARLARVVGWA